jgi:dUTP pyrophosphatase
MANSPGTIDSDYRGEIQLIAINLGREPVVIQRGQRIAQMVVQRIVRAHWQEVQELPHSDRQDGGFGHTDKNNTVQRSKFKKFKARTKRASKS